MNLKKIFVIVLVLVGIYTHNHGMDAGDPINKEALYQAIEDGNLERVRSTVQGCIFDPIESYNATGIRTGNTFVARKIAQNDPQFSFEIFTPLELAIKAGHLEIVQFFIEDYNLDINDQSGGHSAILRCAANYLNLKIVQYLLSKGAKIKPKALVNFEKNCKKPYNKSLLKKTLPILHVLKGGKIVCGVPVTRMNVGIMVAVGAVCAVACKCIYDRYYEASKKSTSDDDEAENVDDYDENKAVVEDQKAELA